MNQTFEHLNEYIQIAIQNNGMPFVVENYVVLREQYYSEKQKQT